MNQEIRIPPQQMQDTFHSILTRRGFTPGRASQCAEIFTQNSLDGVYSHGVNRFGRFVQNVDMGVVMPNNTPVVTNSLGNLEQWDGQMGAGPLNALSATDRAIELAGQHGIGCVAMANTNHWMRGGTYGWRAAQRQVAFICWTNTIANMPAWGAFESKLGNNPLIFAVPFNNEAIVLDMAISQFSYGVMEKVAMSKQMLPVAGGFDELGQITNDPEVILRTNRSLPVGFWKGSGLALLLDIVAAILSGGKSTTEITLQKSESSVSQVFIAFDLKRLTNYSSINELINTIIDDYHSASADNSGHSIIYPGERVLQSREHNLKHGIPVNELVWNDIVGLLA